MLTHQNLQTLWLLLLLHANGEATKFQLFRRLQEGDVRLVGSSRASEGRVEIYHNGRWGTVCDDGWDIAEARVLCRQLKFPGAKEVVFGQNYGPAATGPIWMDDTNCKGTETRLISCAFKGWGSSDCTHKEDVGVVCDTGSRLLQGLTNSTSDASGYSLDHSYTLSDDLGRIFDSGVGCDFTISVNDDKQENGTEEVICAHKMILSQVPLFNASAKSSITVNISQSCQPYFTSFLRYIYTRKIEVTFSSAECIHSMASEFGMRQLMEDAGRLFVKMLPEDSSFQTQVSIYKYASDSEDLVLQENCVQYLAWNFQNMTLSPAWSRLPVELLKALLARSDLVVPDEYFLFQTVESWIGQRGDAVGTGIQAELLNLIRFPMVPAERLYQLESSSLFGAHKDLFYENMLKAFQFNVLLFTNLSSNPKFTREDDDFQPRIYTAAPWSIAFSPSTSQYNRGYNQYYDSRRGGVSYGSPRSLNTPAHNSLLFKDNRVQWEVTVFSNQYECSNRGIRCDSLPMARLSTYNNPQNSVLYRNRLLLKCRDSYVFQVQDFKNNQAHVRVNGTEAASYPCPDDKYTYVFVVRPEYV
ncbi:galectin-3-binding protein A-like [Betta splendens]|uniref:Galectin-3-binding protein A-like n=1 Tax=Betta splendens TaxID=158456 RepID=A0A6P7N9K9_BETSP|nr:galectin-3-binding protein A-like [Betta splendens]XP_055366847.1 galectin-3-binding protein A-like [Betta splendens]